MPEENELPFWRRKPLERMTREEWESLCDGCARCCVIRYEDEDTGEYLETDVVCKLLDLQTCACTNYPQRSRLVPTCLTLTPRLVKELAWMPKTCAYRLIAEGKPLFWWHHLVSGSRETVHEAGISVRAKFISERDVPPDELENHIIDPDG